MCFWEALSHSTCQGTTQAKPSQSASHWIVTSEKSYYIQSSAMLSGCCLMQKYAGFYWKPAQDAQKLHFWISLKAHPWLITFPDVANLPINVFHAARWLKCIRRDRSSVAAVSTCAPNGERWRIKGLENSKFLEMEASWKGVEMLKQLALDAPYDIWHHLIHKIWCPAGDMYLIPDSLANRLRSHRALPRQCPHTLRLSGLKVLPETMLPNAATMVWSWSKGWQS